MALKTAENKNHLSKMCLTFIGDDVDNVAVTTLSAKGQIVIPKEVRKELKLKEGDKLVVVVHGKKLLIQKSKEAKERIKDDFKDLLSFSEYSLKDLWDNKEDEVWNKYLK